MFTPSKKVSFDYMTLHENKKLGCFTEVPFRLRRKSKSFDELPFTSDTISDLHAESSLNLNSDSDDSDTHQEDSSKQTQQLASPATLVEKTSVPMERRNLFQTSSKKHKSQRNRRLDKKRPRALSLLLENKQPHLQE